LTDKRKFIDIAKQVGEISTLELLMKIEDMPYSIEFAKQVDKEWKENHEIHKPE